MARYFLPKGIELSHEVIQTLKKIINLFDEDIIQNIVNLYDSISVGGIIVNSSMGYIFYVYNGNENKFKKDYSLLNDDIENIIISEEDVK